MRLSRMFAIASALVAASSAQLRAQPLSFEGGVCVNRQIQSGYGGFTWGGAAQCVVGSTIPQSGYNTAGGGSTVLFGAFANAFSMSSTSAFNLASFNVAAAWNNNLILNVVGSLGGVQQYSSTTTLTGPYTLQTLSFNWTNIDQLDFSTSGGTNAGNVQGSGTHVAIDDIDTTVVPEPATFALVGAGLVVAMVARRRRQV